MAISFASQVNAWTRKSQNRLEAVFKSSVQELVDRAQTNRNKGGNMPVDTGYLTNSGIADINKVPSGLGFEGSWNPSSAIVVINRAHIGDTLYFGWTAKYSLAMENRYGFMRLAAQQWPQIVKQQSAIVQQQVTR